MTNLLKMPPQNMEAEKALLSAIFHKPDEYDEVSLCLKKEDFYAFAHQCVWEAFGRLKAAGHPIELPSVFQSVLEAKQDGDCPATLLADLWDMPVSGSSAGYFAGMVREASVWRKMVMAGQAIIELAMNRSGSLPEGLQEAERRIFELSEVGSRGTTTSMAEVLRGVITRIGERNDLVRAGGAGVSGVPTGLGDLDAILTGLQKGELVLLAARPSVGKTAVAAAIARNAAVLGYTVLFCSLEQSDEELAERSLSAVSGVNSKFIREGSLSSRDMDALLAGRDQLAPLQIHFDDTSAQSVLHIAANARRLARRPAGLDLIVIDYVQLIEPEDRTAKRHEQVGAISRRLKALARGMNIPVLALAQLNRGVEERAIQKPRLSDLRESGSLEQDADVVILLHREDQNPELLGVEVAKNRNGPTGSLHVRFDRARMRFEQITL